MRLVNVRNSIVTLIVLLCYAQTSAATPFEMGQVSSPYVFSFPRDHGSHPQFGTEWWYFTGLLYEKSAPQTLPRFGVQLTFFRKRLGENSQGYLAHAALTDLSAHRYYHDYRAARSGPLEMAWAATHELDVGIGRWRASQINESLFLEYSAQQGDHDFRVRLLGAFDSPIMLHGDRGLSRKGRCDECASYYYSLPDIKIAGTVTIDAKPVSVTGTLWMDHEFMSNALRPSVLGWDWFSLRTLAGASIMLFRVRHSGPEGDYLSGTFMHPDGRTENLERSDFSIQPLATWKSPITSGEYPIRWRISVPAHGLNVEVAALVPAQEFVSDGQAGEGSVNYWEGAIGSPNNTVHGYLEMTGYDRPIGARF